MTIIWFETSLTSKSDEAPTEQIKSSSVKESLFLFAINFSLLYHSCETLTVVSFCELSFKKYTCHYLSVENDWAAVQVDTGNVAIIRIE